MIELHAGDCLTVLAALAKASVDSLITDPPAGIGFMGRDWDHDRGGRKKCGGTVLDITMGSGSTGLACVAEGFSFVGIDLDEHNVAIARSRLIADAPLFAAAGGLL